NLVEILHRHKLLLYLIEGESPDIFERNGGNILLLIYAAGLFLHIFLQIRHRVTKGFVFCKLCLRRRNKRISVPHIMHIVDGIASAFLKEWTENLSVY